MEHGKSASQNLPMGSRRKALGTDGTMHVLAPKHFRKLGRHYMEDVTDEEIAKVYFGEDLKARTKSISSHKGAITKALKINDDDGVKSHQDEIERINSEVTEIINKVNAFRSA